MFKVSLHLVQWLKSNEIGQSIEQTGASKRTDGRTLNTNLHASSIDGEQKDPK